MLEKNEKRPSLQKPAEVIDHPEHYNRGAMEVINIIDLVLSCFPVDEEFGLYNAATGFNIGNVIKYICRCCHKGTSPIIELEKAKWYLEREIQQLEHRCQHTTSANS